MRKGRSAIIGQWAQQRVARESGVTTAIPNPIVLIDDKFTCSLQAAFTAKNAIAAAAVAGNDRIFQVRLVSNPQSATIAPD